MNLVTPIGNCYYDSVPAIFITGQVNSKFMRKSREIRQVGFQETDIISIVTPICKSAVQVKEASNLPTILEEAFNLALQGRQGPCVVDLPMNIQS